MIELSDMLRPGTKADYRGEMMLGRISLRQFATTWDIILKITLHKLIGRSWAISVGTFTFEIRQTRVKLICFEIFPREIDEMMVAPISGPTISQYFWKKNGGIPSSLGAVEGFI